MNDSKVSEKDNTEKNLFYAAVAVLPRHVRWQHQQPDLVPSIRVVGVLLCCFACTQHTTTA